MWLAFRLCLYAVALAGVNWAMSAWFPMLDQNRELGRSVSAELGRLDGDNDVLFIGDSRTQQGLDPKRFAAVVRAQSGRIVQARNLGRAGMQTPFYYYTLQNYLASADRDPDTIIVAPSYYLLHGRDWMDRIYFAGFVPTDAQVDDALGSGLIDLPEAVAWRLRDAVPLLGYFHSANSNLTRLIQPDPVALAEEFDHQAQLRETLYGEPYRGFLPRGAGHIGPTTGSDGSVFAIDQADPLYLEYFSRFLKLAEEHRINVIVYEYPWPKAHDTPLDRQKIAHYRSVLEAAARPFPNVHFVEYEPFMSHEFFVNPLHLNSAGAGILSRLAARWYVDLDSARTAGRPAGGQ